MRMWRVHSDQQPDSCCRHRQLMLMEASSLAARRTVLETTRTLFVWLVDLVRCLRPSIHMLASNRRATSMACASFALLCFVRTFYKAGLRGTICI